MKDNKNNLERRKEVYKHSLLLTHRIFLLALCLIGVFGLLFFLRPKPTAKLPAPTAETILSGEYAASLTARYTDTYPLIEQFTGLNHALDTAHGFTYAGGIYKDDLDDISDTLAEVAKSNIPVLDPYIDENKNSVCLIFNDGIGGENTDRILDVLEQYDAHATFFLTGDSLEYGSDQVRREISLGCQIGNHTIDHISLTELQPKQIRASVRDLNNKVQQITGIKTEILCPPNGEVKPIVCANAGIPMCLWSVDSMDLLVSDPETIVENATTDIEDGDIILLHDNLETTAEAVERIVPILIDRGYQLLTISEMAQLKGVVLTRGEVYFEFNDLPNNWTDHKIHPGGSSTVLDTTK